MANFKNCDDQDLWGSSSDVSGLDTIVVTEECLLQNVKETTNYILDNVVDGLKSFDTLFSDEIIDGFPNTWNTQDFFLEDQTSLNAQHFEELKDYNLPSQKPQNILLDSVLDQFDSSQPPANNSSESDVHVLSAALPINFQQQASCSVNSDIKKSIEEYDLISSNVVLKLDELAAGAHHACQVANTLAASRASLNSVEAGKKAPRRRRNNCPKEKLYMRIEPFSDEEEEKKRQNAVKAYRNRQKHSSEITKLKYENEELRKHLHDKDQLLQEKDNLIKAFLEAQKKKNMALVNIKLEISKLITN